MHPNYLVTFYVGVFPTLNFPFCQTIVYTKAWCSDFRSFCARGRKSNLDIYLFFVSTFLRILDGFQRAVAVGSVSSFSLEH